MEYKKVLIPKALDQECQDRLSGRDFSEIHYSLYGINESGEIVVKDWLFVGYNHLDENLKTKEFGIFKFSVKGGIVTFELREDMYEKYRGLIKKKLKSWNFVGGLHSHPERKCECEGLYDGECRPGLRCFSEFDLKIGSLSSGFLN